MKIGFLAMSGIRVRDTALLELGLTLPGFVERSQVVASLPSLGLLYLAAVTPESHELVYLEADQDGSEPQELYSCDLVAVSTFSAQIYEAYAVSKRLRSKGIVTAIGGLHASVRPHEAKEHFDHVIVGEGEYIWPHVVEAVNHGASGKIWYSNQFGVVDVAKLPIPRYDLLSDDRYNRITVQTSRGCPWRCDFCASSVMLHRGYRKRPVEDVIRDITEIKRIKSRPFIEFADDNTFVDKRWGKELCRQLIPLKIKWFTETDISIAEDPALLQLMAAAGCRQVLIGLESPTNDALEGIEQKANFKAKQFHKYREAIQTIQQYGISVNACFILGLDEHTNRIFDEVYEFVESALPYDVQITVLTPFPGTPLYERLKQESRLTHPYAWDRCTLFDINYKPKRMSAAELQYGLYRLAGNLYTAEAVRKRRDAFFSRLRSEAKSQLSTLKSQEVLAA